MPTLNPKCGSSTKAAFAKRARGALPAKVTWYASAEMALPGMSRTATHDIFRAVFRMANSLLRIKFERTKLAKTALIVLKIGPAEEFDGRGGVLAMADMLNLRDKEQREIWFDGSEQWSDGQASEWETYALNVTAHELGHTLGFGHGKTGLMAPYYNPYVLAPTEGEMERYFREYPELAA